MRVSGRRRRALRQSMAAGCAGLLLLAACGEAGDNLPDPRDGRSGIQLSGRLGGRQVAVNDGLPELNTGDCDVNSGADRDLCIVTEDLSGELVIVVFENPAVLVAGASLPITTSCGSPAACDDVTDGAVVEVQFGLADRERVRDGRVEVEAAERFLRYRGTLALELRDGRLDGAFDVVPRPD